MKKQTLNLSISCSAYPKKLNHSSVLNLKHPHSVTNRSMKSLKKRKFGLNPSKFSQSLLRDRKKPAVNHRPVMELKYAGALDNSDEDCLLINENAIRNLLNEEAAFPQLKPLQTGKEHHSFLFQILKVEMFKPRTSILAKSDSIKRTKRLFSSLIRERQNIECGKNTKRRLFVDVVGEPCALNQRGQLCVRNAY